MLSSIRLAKFPGCSAAGHTAHFHVRRRARDEHAFPGTLFAARGDVVFADLPAAHRFADSVNAKRATGRADALQASQLNAMGLVHEVFHIVVARYREAVGPGVFRDLLGRLRAEHGAELDRTLRAFVEEFPPPPVYAGEASTGAWLGGSSDGAPNEEWALEEMLLAWLGNENPAYAPIAPLVSDDDLRRTTPYLGLLTTIRNFFADQPRFGPDAQNLVDVLLAPIRNSPGSILGQLEFMRDRWGLDTELLRRMLLATDFVKEEGKWFLRQDHGGGDPSPPPASFHGELYETEPERFSTDLHWMPRVVMLAKSAFVWLEQLAKTYRRQVRTLADIPDEELDRLASRGLTGLWLIGIWQRSRASLQIKQRMGNSDAVASAYSLHDYEIAPELGGWDAYRSLRERAQQRGIRLASDMVPNHVGIDSRWMIEHPDWFVQTREPPFPSYRFGGPDLSEDDRVGIFIEEGYWTKTDAAVVFRRTDRHTGDTRFVYHGNDGTSMPWNDTAQLDYTKAEVREAVIQTILHVARLFPIIRFDAAMTLAKRHYQRLWFPLPGSGGDIPSRAAHAMTKERFDEVFPVEFWREVVDRVATEVPDTLLLAEAFWMMEGYFVRTLGMHRVYNSAFMHMFKKEDNAGYRASIKNVLAFGPQILKRYVNFMNNPDEDTAIAQFGRDDKYFGVCTVLSTMPGLPMFGHGQIEGFAEKYGMEYKRAYWDETPDHGLVERHEREIFPLLRKRALFSDVEAFTLYDVFADNGEVDEDVFAYSNRMGHERALVVYHNKYKETRGWIRTSVGFLDGAGQMTQRSLAEGLAIDGSHDVFSVFRDHTTGLEHIRENAELAERGLFVELGAFKYHVFWEFRDVRSTAERPYRALAERLGGRGVPSIDEALVDVTFAPLHDAVRAAIAGDAELAPLVAALAPFAKVPIESTAAVDDALGARLARAKEPESPAWLAGWAVSAALGALAGEADPIAEWRLDRVLGADTPLVRVLLRAPEPDEDDAEPLASRVRALLDDPEARVFLGVNTHNGVSWLRKEPLVVLVDALAAIADPPAPDAAHILALASTAGYAVVAFRASLEPGDPPTAG